MKTSELTGARLDYWVAKATRGDTETLRDFEFWKHEVWECGQDRFSTDWAQGGPIIEQKKIEITPTETGWAAAVDPWRYYSPQVVSTEAPSADGETALIAAMRALVASKYGDEVPEVSP